MCAETHAPRYETTLDLLLIAEQVVGGDFRHITRPDAYDMAAQLNAMTARCVWMDEAYLQLAAQAAALLTDYERESSAAGTIKECTG